MPEIEVTPYRPASWFTPEGAAKKLSAMEKKGLPSFRNWRFITLTVDQKQFSSAQGAYEYIKPRMRYFMRDLRAYLGKGKLRYCWKLEFQENGWPHYHMLLDYHDKIDHSDLLSMWGHGFVHLSRVRGARLPYQFKYVCKEVGELPSWFTAQKRPRCFQSSRLFTAKVTPKNEAEGDGGSEDAPPPRRANSETLSQRLLRWSQLIQVKIGEKFTEPLNIGESWGKWLHRIWLVYGHDNGVRYRDAWSLLIPKSLLLTIQTEQLEYGHTKR